MLAILAGFGVAAPVNAAVSPLPPEQVTSSDGGIAADVAVNRLGDTAVVWIKRRPSDSPDCCFEVYLSRKESGDAEFEPPQLISQDRLLEAPQVDIDDEGNAVVAWSDALHATTGQRFEFNVETRVRVVSSDPHGDISDPETISLPGKTVDKVSLIVAPGGGRTVAWLQRGPGEQRIIVSRQIGGSWTVPDDVSGPGVRTFDLETSRGAPVLAWSRPDRASSAATGSVVETAVGQPGGGFAQRQSLAVPDRRVIELDLATALASERLAVGWTEQAFACGMCLPDSVGLGVDPGSGLAEQARTGVESLAYAAEPAVAVDAQGDTTLAWLEREVYGARAAAYALMSGAGDERPGPKSALASRCPSVSVLQLVGGDTRSSIFALGTDMTTKPLVGDLTGLRAAAPSGAAAVDGRLAVDLGPSGRATMAWISPDLGAYGVRVVDVVIDPSASSPSELGAPQC